MKPFFETDRLQMRPFAYSDIPDFLAYRLDPDIARFQSWSVLDAETAGDFIDVMQATKPGVPGDGYQMGVALRDSDLLIGDLYLKLLEYDRRQAEIGYTVSRQYQGKGYGTEAVTGLLDYVFFVLELHRVIAYAATENVRSVKLLERVGFRCEGHLRQSVHCDGKWQDEYLFAILVQEWRMG